MRMVARQTYTKSIHSEIVDNTLQSDLVNLHVGTINPQTSHLQLSTWTTPLSLRLQGMKSMRSGKKKELDNEYPLKELGEPDKFLGCHLIRDYMTMLLLFFPFASALR